VSGPLRRRERPPGPGERNTKRGLPPGREGSSIGPVGGVAKQDCCPVNSTKRITWEKELRGYTNKKDPSVFVHWEEDNGPSRPGPERRKEKRRVVRPQTEGGIAPKRRFTYSSNAKRRRPSWGTEKTPGPRRAPGSILQRKGTASSGKDKKGADPLIDQIQKGPNPH